MLRTRHRVATFSRTTTGRFVELAVPQRPSAGSAVALAQAELERGVAGAMAYTAAHDPDDEEQSVTVLLRLGWTPAENDEALAAGATRASGWTYDGPVTISSRAACMPPARP